jgi:hypothetical protein
LGGVGQVGAQIDDIHISFGGRDKAFAEAFANRHLLDVGVDSAVGIENFWIDFWSGFNI